MDLEFSDFRQLAFGGVMTEEERKYREELEKRFSAATHDIEKLVEMIALTER